MSANAAAVLALLGPLLTGCGSEPAGPDDGIPTDTMDPGHIFTYSPPDGAPTIRDMSVRGSFNDWGETAMAFGTAGDWRVNVDLADGTHTYKFFINDAWIADMCYDPVWGDPSADYAVDPDAAGCVSDGHEGQNAFVVIGDVPLEFRHSPGDPAYVSRAGGALSIRFRARAEGVEAARIIAGSDTTPMHPQLTVGVDRVWRAPVPAATAHYSIHVVTSDSTTVFGPYDAPAEPFESVDWVEGAVAYQIFPERFWNGDPTNDSAALATDEYEFRDPALESTPPVLSDWSDPPEDPHCCHQYFGGDIRGIMDRLDHLEELGADVVYLNPIFAAGSAHGYDTFDYRQVAPHFGDSTTLRSLVDAAHARGIRLIWDFVPNHVGIGHWAFQDAITNGEASGYWDWFEFHVPADSIQAGNGEHYDAWWGFGSLPELQTVNPEVMDHLMDVARGWTEFGLDGIRVDVPNEIDNRQAFFTTFRDVVKGVDPGTYLVGEIWERDATWLQGDQFDALMNYAIGERVVERFARGDSPGVVAARDMADLYAAYPEAATAMLFNLVASHDTDRLLTKMGGGELGGSPSAGALARQRLAAALLFALPGMPVTFQGDECAFLGGREGRHLARYPIQWDDCDPAMIGHYAALAGLKHALPALTSPAIREYDATTALLAFFRGEPGSGELLAVFNNGAAGQSLALPDGSWSDVVSGAAASGSVALDGYGWRYLVRED